jgi:hypothetical protein
MEENLIEIGFVVLSVPFFYFTIWKSKFEHTPEGAGPARHFANFVSKDATVVLVTGFLFMLSFVYRVLLGLPNYRNVDFLAIFSYYYIHLAVTVFTYPLRKAVVMVLVYLVMLLAMVYHVSVPPLFHHKNEIYLYHVVLPVFTMFGFARSVCVVYMYHKQEYELVGWLHRTFVWRLELAALVTKTIHYQLETRDPADVTMYPCIALLPLCYLDPTEDVLLDDAGFEMLHHGKHLMIEAGPPAIQDDVRSLVLEDEKTPPVAVEEEKSHKKKKKKKHLQ